MSLYDVFEVVTCRDEKNPNKNEMILDVGGTANVPSRLNAKPADLTMTNRHSQNMVESIDPTIKHIFGQVKGLIEKNKYFFPGKEPDMKAFKLTWSSPYKTKLWLFSMNSDLFCKKELELWDVIASRGPKGCDAYNYRLGQEIHRSKAQVKRYLRNLKRHHLIWIVPGWARLQGDVFAEELRCRRIIALPWPNRQAWMAGSIQLSLLGWGVKNEPLQRSLSKTKINQSRDGSAEVAPRQESFPSNAGGLAVRGGAVQGSIEDQRLYWSLHNARKRSKL